MERTIFSPNIIERAGGSGVIVRTREVRLDDYWVITGIPFDVSDETAVNTIRSFFSLLRAFEIPTSLACNLDCKYCYIRDQQLKDKNVTVDVVEKICNLFDKQIIKKYTNVENEDKKPIASSWGAEPFMNLSTLEFLADWAAANNYSVHLSTNGTIITDKAIEVLEKIIKASSEQTIQISIDGPPDIQNESRPFKNGGAGTYDNVVKFTKIAKELSKKYHNKNMVGFSSTIYMMDYKYDRYIKAVDFFADPTVEDGLFFNGYSPVRIEHHLDYTPEFSDAAKLALIGGEARIIHHMKKHKMPIISWYVYNLFDKRCAINGVCSCSALQSQIAIDLDGTMYPCHGPITTPKLKPYFQLGNIFEGWIDYRMYMSALDAFVNEAVFLAPCKECPLLNDKLITGRLCFNCPILSSSIDGFPISIDIMKCQTYQYVFPYFKHSYKIYKEFYERERRAK